MLVVGRLVNASDGQTDRQTAAKYFIYRMGKDRIVMVHVTRNVQ